MDRERKTVLALIGCVAAGSIGLAALCVVGVAAYTLFQLRPVASLGGGVPPSSAFPDVPRVAVSTAYAAYQDGSAVFVDARSLGQYEQAHIPGAQSIPVNEIADRLDELDPGTWIITYCT